MALHILWAGPRCGGRFGVWACFCGSWFLEFCFLGPRETAREAALCKQPEGPTFEGAWPTPL